MSSISVFHVPSSYGCQVYGIAFGPSCHRCDQDVYKGHWHALGSSTKKTVTSNLSVHVHSLASSPLTFVCFIPAARIQPPTSFLVILPSATACSPIIRLRHARLDPHHPSPACRRISGRTDEPTSCHPHSSRSIRWLLPRPPLGHPSRAPRAPTRPNRPRAPGPRRRQPCCRGVLRRRHLHPPLQAGRLHRLRLHRAHPPGHRRRHARDRVLGGHGPHGSAGPLLLQHRAGRRRLHLRAPGPTAGVSYSPTSDDARRSWKHITDSGGRYRAGREGWKPAHVAGSMASGHDRFGDTWTSPRTSC